MPFDLVTGRELRAKAAKSLADTTDFLFFDENQTVLTSSFSVVNPEQELASVKSAFQGSREDAMRNGIQIQAHRFEVHRFDPPLIYGRVMTCDPIQSEAFAVLRLERSLTGVPAYGVITFKLPNLTARLVPKLKSFCEEHLQATA